MGHAGCAQVNLVRAHPALASKLGTAALRGGEGCRVLSIRAPGTCRQGRSTAQLAGHVSQNSSVSARGFEAGSSCAGPDRLAHNKWHS